MVMARRVSNKRHTAQRSLRSVERVEMFPLAKRTFATESRTPVHTFTRPQFTKVQSSFSSYTARSAPVRHYASATLNKVAMPALSPTMEKGNLAKWRKQEGDKITTGEVLCEIETDKATLEFEAAEDGFLGKILVPEGTADIPVGQIIAVTVESEADLAAAKDYSEGAATPSQPAAAAKEEPAASRATPQAAPAIDVDVIEVGMPALSPTMEKGNLAKWRKQEGDKVTTGEVLCEIETDKATLEFEAPEDGFLGKILVSEGTSDVPVGQPIAVIVENEADVSKLKSYQPGKPAEKQTPAAAGAAAAKPATTTAAPTPSAAVSRPSGERVFASPLARKVAKEAGVEISKVPTASGPNNRVIKADVEQFLTTKPQAKAPEVAAPKVAAAKAAAAAVETAEYVDVPTSGVRRVIAQRLQESKQNIPHYYLSVDVRMDKVMKVREELNAKAGGSFKVSVNDFMIKASAQAMKDVPAVNSSWRQDVIRQYKNVDVSVAVQTDFGLITPIVKNAETLGLKGISEAVKDLATRARANKLMPEEYQGGTFTISNLGMFGIKSFSAIINPPQACILAVGAAETRVVPKAGAKEGEQPFEFGSFVTVTLSCDHRVVDGAVGAEWLKSFKKYLEDPVSMLL